MYAKCKRFDKSIRIIRINFHPSSDFRKTVKIDLEEKKFTKNVFFQKLYFH